ncbi:MAG: PAS domain S-box protein [Deltaproteobacteria bacterium]|nr:PAS domain S-box protein [Deltaproteobacteria bacterium]
MKREPDRSKNLKTPIQKSGLNVETLFNVIQDGIAVLDETLTIVQHNAAMEDLVGRPFIGEKCYKAIRGRNEPCEECQTLLAFEHKTMQSREIKVESGNGEVTWRQAFSFPMLDQNGKAIGAVEYIQNITARKKAEEALKESEQKYRALFKNAPVGIGIVDDRGDIIDFNDSILRPGGYNRRDAANIGNVSELYRSPGERTVISELARKQGFVDNYEIQLRRKDGTFYDALLSLRAIKIQGKMCWQSIAQDITPLKSAEEALRRAHDELEEKVQERTRELAGKTRTLEELNTALKVLLERREDDKKETQEKITLSINQLIKPYLEKLKTTGLTGTQSAFLGIIESNLNEIFSPFTEKFSSKYLRLTPAEIQVANLVKQGKITKEIAEMLNLSVRTIESHRKNIRKKLGITDKKSNLRTHLMSLQ